MVGRADFLKSLKLFSSSAFDAHQEQNHFHKSHFSSPQYDQCNLLDVTFPTNKKEQTNIFLSPANTIRRKNFTIKKCE